VVVVCESCSTRFRIDDAAIPAKGRLVRCSQCKATFIAKPEDATFEETVQEVVAEVTDSGGEMPVPEPSTDLFDEVPENLGETATRPAGSSDEERWEFDEEPRRRESAPLVRDEPATEPPSSPLDEIGDPMEWDLLRGVEREAKQAAFVEEPPPPPPPPPPPVRVQREEVDAAAETEPFLRPIASEPAAAPVRTARRAPSGALGRFARGALSLGAWSALALLTYVAAQPLMPHEAEHTSSRAAPRTIGLADGEARNVRGRFVENAFASALFVVEGELARPGADPRLGLRVHFMSADGAAVGEPAWAGSPLGAEELRERAPAALQGELDASAAAAARGGRFVAVFEEAPAGATTFGLALEPLPAALAPEAPAAEATASSPPSSPPSSE
jgi:predicted Zn finger-like uncharacterized protein